MTEYLRFLLKNLFIYLFIIIFSYFFAAFDSHFQPFTCSIFVLDFQDLGIIFQITSKNYSILGFKKYQKFDMFLNYFLKNDKIHEFCLF